MSILDNILGFDHHHHPNPWADAPPWAVELREAARIILRNQETIMTTQTDIAAALAKVQADVAAQTTETASLQTYVQGIQAQLAAIAGQTTDTTTADALNALSSQIEANTATDAGLILQNTPSDPSAGTGSTGTGTQTGTGTDLTGSGSGSGTGGAPVSDSPAAQVANGNVKTGQLANKTHPNLTPGQQKLD